MKTAESRTQWPLLTLGISAFLGSVLRIFPGIMTGFPLNDGGMFLVMVRDLRSNHYLLPRFTSYNFSDIPFAYPPFGIYFAALLRDLLHVPEMESLRWLPALTSILSIYAFYLLASRLLKDNVRGAAATAIYALAPGSYDWFIMGGGLTRAFGSLFLLVSLYFLLQTLEHGGRKNLLLAILFCSLTVLSHPEYGMHAAASCLLLCFFHGISRQRTVRAALIGFGTIALTSIWWIPLLATHGIAPVISALHTGLYERNSALVFLQSVIAWNSSLPILLFFRLAGGAWAIWKRNYLLLAWMALPYFVEPRSAPAIAFYPVAMLTALGLTDALPWLIHRFRGQKTESMPLTESRWFNAATFLLILSLFVESSLLSFRLINNTLKPSALEAFAWTRDNTPDDSRFIILTGKVDAMVDPVQEWFPALAERRSQTTLQGLEWTLAGRFSRRLENLGELQSCDTVTCVEGMAAELGLDYTYVLIKKESASVSIAGALSSGGYELIYENEDFALLER